MKEIIRATLFLAGIVTTAAMAQSPKPAEDDSALLLGDWRGDSICVVHPSACHDEKALYHIKKLGDQPNRYSMQLDKIVEGKAEEMGTAECRYAPEKHVLTCPRPNLVLHFTLKSKSLDGTMNLRDGTLWRNITLRHD